MNGQVKFTRIFAVIFTLGVLAVFSLLVFWFILGGKERLRTQIVTSLRPVLGQTFDIATYSLYPRSIVFQDVTLDPTRALHIDVKAVSIRISPYMLIQGVIDWEGAIEEIELIEPRFSLLAIDSADGSPVLPSYQAYSFKKLAALKVIRRMLIRDGSISRTKLDRLIANKINGQLDLIDPTHAALNLRGEMPILEQTGIDVTGSGDVTTGEFYASFRLDIPFLDQLNLARNSEQFRLESGRASCEVELWGGADLRYIGSFTGDSIAASYSEHLSISEGSISGSLFGQSAKLSGKMKVNSNPVEFTANVSDLFNRIWRGQLSSHLQLQSIREALPGSPALQGEVKVSAKLNGSGSNWGGDLEITSPKVIFEDVKLLESSANLVLENGGLRLEQFKSTVLGGELTLTGEADLKNGSIDVRGGYHAEWSEEDLPPWSSLGAPVFSSNFGLTRKEGVWFGGGSGELQDSAGVVRSSLEIELAHQELRVEVHSPTAQRSSLTFTYTPEGDVPLHLSGREPQYFLVDLIKPGYLPDRLFQYAFKLEAQGTLERIEGSLSAEGGTPVRGGEIGWLLNRSGKNWSGSISSDIRLPDRSRLVGFAKLRLADGTFELQKGTLRTESGEKVLEAELQYSIDEKKFENFGLKSESLPIVELLRLVYEGIEPGLNANADIEIVSEEQEFDWNGKIRVTYPDSARYLIESNGFFTENSISVRQATLSSLEADTVFMSASGSFDVGQNTFDSVVVSLSQFSVERAIEVFIPRLKGRFGGVLNARIDLSGNLQSPSLYADFHLIGSTLYGDPGYWANITATGSNGDLEIGNFVIGYGLKSLLTGRGKLGLSTKSFWLEAMNNQCDVGRLVKAMSGLNIPIKGNGDVFIYLDDKGLKQGQAKLEMRNGSLGGLPFRSLNTWLSLSGLNQNEPVLGFDTMRVEWDHVIGSVSGELPLTSRRSIDMAITLEGQMAGFLPNIYHGFSNPSGSGRIDLKLGGDIHHPKLKSGQFQYHNGGFLFDQVFREVRHLEADLSLDSTGWVSINRFDFQIDETPITITNRRPDPPLVEKSMIIYGYDLGVLQLRTADEGFWIVIPGLMEKTWGGYLAFSGVDRVGPFEMSGPADKPHATGEVNLRNAIVTYPLLHVDGKPSKFVKALLTWLMNIQWNATLVPEFGCRYFREVSGLGELRGWGDIKNQIGGGLLDPDLKIIVDLQVDDNPMGLHFDGSIKESLKLSGELTSVQGSIEFLDLDFQVEKVGIQFNPAMIDPTLYGTASTTVLDSAGIERQVRIRIGSTQSDAERLSGENSDRAYFSDLTLTFEDDQGHSQEQVLVLLGYTPEQLPGKLSGLGGQFVESATPLKKWQRGFERILEQWTGLDRIAVQTNVAQNLIERQFNPIGTVNQQEAGSYWNLFYGSRVTLGKYVMPNLYLSYTGALASQTETYEQTRLGIQHSWDANYRLTRISNNLVLNYKFEYNELAQSSINSTSIRYGWVFDLRSQIAKVWK